MELIFVMFVVVVIIVTHLDNVANQGIVQDGADKCVIVVLVMIYSFRVIEIVLNVGHLF